MSTMEDNPSEITSQRAARPRSEDDDVLVDPTPAKADTAAESETVEANSSTSSSPWEARKKIKQDDSEVVRDGIAQKMANLNRKIEHLQGRIRESTEKGKSKEMTEMEKLVDLLLEERALRDKKDALLTSFEKGQYYALTDAYLEVNPEERQEDTTSWAAFVRTPSKKYEIRYRAKGSEVNTVLDSYKLTREAISDSKCEAPASETARASSMPQSDRTTRDAVWPTDIFGNLADWQEIAHLVPAGRSIAHKQWLNVAGAVVGLDNSTTFEAKKKAIRGCIDAGPPRSRKHGTGVVHFVSNKIRLANQAHVLDGMNPSCLIVPVMTLENAKAWKGEGYNAICLAGRPRGGILSPANSASPYGSIGLTKVELTSVFSTCDANQEEINTACEFLKQAVFALHDMIENLQEHEIEYGSGNLRVACDEAKSKICKVPCIINEISSQRKPVCLVTFGKCDEDHLHPAPDPLLLVLRAANVFGIMAGMKMLASAMPEDGSDIISEGDIMEEEAFLEAREQSYRPKSWSDLAIGLGQPNGYFAS